MMYAGRRDFWTKKAAEQLAVTLRKYWLKRGYRILVWLVEAPGEAKFSNQPRYDIRSDMKNGWPRSSSIIRLAA